MAEARPPLPTLEAVREVVEAACDLVLRMLQDPIRDWEKKDESPVTSIDIAVDRFLNTQLRPLCPDACWLSEETADDPVRRDAARLWVVDPIDGTRSLLAGLPEFCVSVGLVESGRPMLGIIANPSTGECFLAERGRGAFDGEGRPLRARDRYDGAAPGVLVSRTDLRKGLWQGVLDGAALTPMGSLAYKMALVAAGRFDGHATPTPRSEWDAAAGALLLEEAGGMATDLHGRPLGFNQARPCYDGMVVASRAAHGPMLALARLTAERYELLSQVDEA